MDLGLVILRVVFGLLMIGHGTQKLFGWFRGPGLHGASGFVASRVLDRAPDQPDAGREPDGLRCNVGRVAEALLQIG